MDPIRNMPRKFTKKFGNKVINRQYFRRKTGLKIPHNLFSQSAKIFGIIEKRTLLGFRSPCANPTVEYKHFRTQFIIDPKSTFSPALHTPSDHSWTNLCSEWHYGNWNSYQSRLKIFRIFFQLKSVHFWNSVLHDLRLTHLEVLSADISWNLPKN